MSRYFSHGRNIFLAFRSNRDEMSRSVTISHHDLQGTCPSLGPRRLRGAMLSASRGGHRAHRRVDRFEPGTTSYMDIVREHPRCQANGRRRALRCHNQRPGSPGTPGMSPPGGSYRSSRSAEGMDSLSMRRRPNGYVAATTADRERRAACGRNDTSDPSGFAPRCRAKRRADAWPGPGAAAPAIGWLIGHATGSLGGNERRSRSGNRSWGPSPASLVRAAHAQRWWRPPMPRADGAARCRRSRSNPAIGPHRSFIFARRTRFCIIGTSVPDNRSR